MYSFCNQSNVEERVKSREYVASLVYVFVTYVIRARGLANNRIPNRGKQTSFTVNRLAVRTLDDVVCRSQTEIYVGISAGIESAE